MRRLHPNGFSSADNLIKTLALLDVALEKTDHILDFGCGNGAMVYEFMERGHDNVCGFDIHNYTDLRDPSDSRLFRFLETTDTATSNCLMDGNFRLPYEDASFDFIFSSQVLEHIHNLDIVAREIARVLKPGGLAIHVYPSRTALIETHTLIPLNGLFHSPSYMRFWALAGIRNEHQKGLSPDEVLNRNLEYHKTGLFYRSRRQVTDICRPHYSKTTFLANQFYQNLPFYSPSKIFHLMLALTKPHRLRNLASAMKMEVLATFK